MSAHGPSWGDRARAALATLGSAPWRRAPGLLRHRTGVLVATAGACAVLAAALASVPLFLSSAGTEAVAVQAAERCPRDTGATYVVPPKPGSQLGAPDPFVPLADRLAPSIQWGRFEASMSGSAPSAATDVVVLYRDRALDHVDVVEGAPLPGGVWVSDRLVEMTGLGLGDRPAIGGVPTPIAGVYRDLASGTISDAFWCAHRTDLLVRGPDLAPPTPVVIADRETWFSLEGSARSAALEAAWEAPLRNDLTVAKAETLVEDLACDGPKADDLAWCAGGRPTVRSDPVPRATIDDRQIVAPDAATFVERYFGSSAPYVVERARAIQVAVGNGIWPVAALAAVAGAALVAASALLWLDRRQREVRLLVVRGLSPAAVALKALLELLVALVLGSSAGVLLAYGLVVGTGPSPTLEPVAVLRASALGGASLLLATLVIASVIAFRVRAVDAGTRRRTRLGAVPWEMTLVLAAALSLRRLDSFGVPVSRGADVTEVDVVGLLFPVLFLLAVVSVLARVLGLALRPLRSLSRAWPSALFLAVRRVSRYRTAVTGLVAASAIATGVIAYAATIQRSMEATLEAKAQTYLGSDVVVRVASGEPIPDSLSARSTRVDRYDQAWVDVGRQASVRVLAIDPATFPRAAFWDEALAPMALEEILGGLAAPSASGRVPAVVVGLDVPAVAEAAIVTNATTRFEIAEVAEVAGFPGMRRGSPTMFVAASSLDDLGVSARRGEIWVRGGRTEILAKLDDAGATYEEPITTGRVADGVSSLTVTQTFGFMRSLGLAAGVLVVGGLAMYFDSRRRSRVLGYAFARRMGLARRQHRWALLMEALAGVGVGSWLGLAAGVVGAGLAHGRLDPLPSFRPDPLLRTATGVIAVLGAAALLLAVLAAVVAQRMTDEDDPVEVLRAGT